MRPHIILKTKIPVNLLEIPYWVDFISDKSVVIESFQPEVNQIFNINNIKFWVCSEYKSTGSRWSEVEISSGLDRIYRLIIQNDVEIPKTIIVSLSHLSNIEYARIGEISSSIIPSSQFAHKFNLLDIPTGLIHLKQAHLITLGSSQIKIAVLDTGVNILHPEIKHAVLEGMDFVNIIDGAEKFVGDFLEVDSDPNDEVGHGTHVSGIIVGKGIKIAKGVAPNCKIIPVRVLGAMRQGETKIGAGLIDNINTGIKWAVDNGADIINMSLGIKNDGGGVPHQEVINYAIKKGVTIIAASGNDGTDDKYYPGALPDVIAVGAIDENGNTAPFSTYGWHITIVAPGTNIMSSYVENKYAISSGTSQASPYVTGVVALLKSYAIEKGIKLNNSQIKNLLIQTADKQDKQSKSIKQGYGKLNAFDSLKLLKYKLQFN